MNRCLNINWICKVINLYELPIFNNIVTNQQQMHRNMCSKGCTLFNKIVSEKSLNLSKKVKDFTTGNLNTPIVQFLQIF